MRLASVLQPIQIINKFDVHALGVLIAVYEGTENVEGTTGDKIPSPIYRMGLRVQNFSSFLSVKL